MRGGPRALASLPAGPEPPRTFLNSPPPRQGWRRESSGVSTGVKAQLPLVAVWPTSRYESALVWQEEATPRKHISNELKEGSFEIPSNLIFSFFLWCPVSSLHPLEGLIFSGTDSRWQSQASSPKAHGSVHAALVALAPVPMPCLSITRAHVWTWSPL